MWVKASGQLSENVYQFSTAVSSHLLVVGEEVALIDTGPTALQGKLFEELEKFLEDPSQLSVVLLTHAHFDHVGGLPYLRSKLPQLKCFVSKQSSELIENKTFLKSLYEENVRAAAAAGVDIGMDESVWMGAFTIDRVLGDGDVVDLGADVQVKLISVPGHTVDSSAYYVHGDNVLCAGEAVGGYSGRDKYIPCFRSNYLDYLKSLDRMASLEVKVLGLPHAGALTGEIAPKFLLEARREAERFASQVKERLTQGELVDEIAASIIPEWQSQNFAPEGPFAEMQTQTVRDMVRLVAEEK